jgi:galactokinase
VFCPSQTCLREYGNSIRPECDEHEVSDGCYSDSAALAVAEQAVRAKSCPSVGKEYVNRVNQGSYVYLQARLTKRVRSESWASCNTVSVLESGAFTEKSELMRKSKRSMIALVTYPSMRLSGSCFLVCW